MRVTKYSVELDQDRKNVLVKENSKKLPCRRFPEYSAEGQKYAG